MALENTSGTFVNLDLPDAGQSGPVQSEVKAADAGEGGEVGEGHDTPPEIFGEWLDTVSTGATVDT